MFTGWSGGCTLSSHPVKSMGLNADCFIQLDLFVPCIWIYNVSLELDLSTKDWIAGSDLRKTAKLGRAAPFLGSIHSLGPF
jgi:hypothetical protein